MFSFRDKLAFYSLKRDPTRTVNRTNVFVVSIISFIMLISRSTVVLVIVKRNVQFLEEERDPSLTESLRQPYVVTVPTVEAIRERRKF